MYTRATGASIGVRDLRNNVAAVLRRAAGGERLVVTVDGRPVAMLGPLIPGAGATLDDLIAAGLVEPPRRSRREAPPSRADVAVDVRLDRVVADIRGE